MQCFRLGYPLEFTSLITWGGGIYTKCMLTVKAGKHFVVFAATVEISIKIMHGRHVLLTFYKYILSFYFVDTTRYNLPPPLFFPHSMLIIWVVVSIVHASHFEPNKDWAKLRNILKCQFRAIGLYISTQNFHVILVFMQFLVLYQQNC